MTDHLVLVDCTTCPVRGVRCDDCMVTAMQPAADGSPDDLPLDRAERAAVAVFVAAGLVDAAEAATLRARRERRRPGQAAG